MSDNAEQQVAEPAAPVAPPERPGREYEPKMPAAVRRAARRAEELQAEQQAAQEAEQQAEAQTQEAAAPPPQASPQVSEEDTWQHRYRTLQGKYDSELPSLRTQVQQLERLIATMHTAPAGPPPAAEPPPPPPVSEIPEEDYTAYGPDFVDSSRRWARAEISPIERRLDAQIAELRTAQEKNAAERIQEGVKAELSRDPELAGRWEQIDHDQRFHAWLNEPDPFSGAQRLSMLHQAFTSGDATRTGRFFKAFLNELTPSASFAPGSQAQTSNGAGQVDLGVYAAPGRASNATPGPGAPEKRIYSNREVQAFYADRIRGRYRGREAESNALERDIVLAGNEGRIRNI